jgi:hypothetical protein
VDWLKNYNTINENSTPAEKDLYNAICQRISAGNEKKKTVGKTMDHEKKMTHQNKVLPGKFKLKKQKNDGEETDSNDNDYLKKKQSHAAPGITKEKGMYDRKDEVQVIEGTYEKKAVVRGKRMLRSPWNSILLKSGMNLRDRLLKQ